MDPMLESFLQESRDNLESVGHCFLELEKSAGDAELLNDLFRSIHTIKGSSGLFDIAPLTRVVHAAEDVLDRVREGEFELEAEHIDLFLDAMDQVEAWLDDLEDTEQLGDKAEARGQVLAEKLRVLLGNSSAVNSEATDTSSNEDGEPSVPVPQTRQEAPKWLEDVSHEARIIAFKEAITKGYCFTVVYTPDKQCFFNGDDPLYNIQDIQGLIWYQALPVEEWGDIEALDPFESNLQIQLLITADESSIREQFRYVAEQIELTLLVPEQLVFPIGTIGELQQFGDVLQLAEKAILNNDLNSLKNGIKPVLGIVSSEFYQSSALAWMVALIEQQETVNLQLLQALLDSTKTGQFSLQQQQNDMEQTLTTTSKHPIVGIELSDSIKELLNTQINILSLNSPKNLFKGKVLSTKQTVAPILKTFVPSLFTSLEEVVKTCLAENNTDGFIALLEQALQSNTVREQDEQLAGNQADAGDSIIDLSHISNNARAVLQTQADILSSPCADNLLKGRIASTVNVLKRIFNQFGMQVSDTLDELQISCESQHSSQPLIEYLTSLKITAEQVEKHTQAAINKETPQAVQASPANKSAAKPAKESESNDVAKNKAVNKTLRVDQERIDGLMDLIGELIVAKNALPFLARKAEEEFNVKPLAKEIKAQYAVINRLADELQNAIMSVRMVPVSSVFQRFPRLVRDISRRLDKNIQLIMEGEETEADKNVIENLADPLIHLVRNSLDHGIELPDERLAQGKPEQGSLILRATPNDDQVIIEIIDDGKGIDPNIIKHKAYEKGMIDEYKLDSISDQESIELIFAAGLSSKEEASDISGRGVGMDVVRTAIQEAGGNVTVSSKLGKGTTMRLSLPLSMAVAQVMMIEVNSQVYGISMDQIRETVRVPVDQIHRIKHTESIVLRNKLIPLRRMCELLHLSEKSEHLEEEAILIVTVNGEEVGLIIDDFHEGIDVIQKPLEGVMSHYPTYAGATLLGDGRVLLILDIQELIACP